MPTGRPPKPTRLKVITGNPGRRPLNAAEPEPEAAAPPKPDHLNGPAAAEWDRIVGELTAIGMMTRIDRAVLAGYCQTWGRWVEAEEAVSRDGPTTESRTGTPMVSPDMKIAEEALRTMLRYMVELGLTPSSRSRVKRVAEAAPEDPAEQFFA